LLALQGVEQGLPVVGQTLPQQISVHRGRWDRSEVILQQSQGKACLCPGQC
jgi:hypothetical protein